MADPMNLSSANPGLTPQIWDAKFFAEYIRENQFAPLMGQDEDAIIQMKDDLQRRPGDRVTFAFVGRLVGAGVTGHQVLRGNEEILNDRSMVVIVNPIRHAVAIDKWTAQQSAIDKRQAAKVGLKGWSVEKLRSDIITAFFAINGVPYASATSTQLNTWLTYNSDRVLFGDKRSNTVTANYASSLATLTASAAATGIVAGSGRMSKAALEMAKRVARSAHPRFRPYRTKKGVEWFIAYLHPLQFRDLRNDPAYRADMQWALERGKDNPLFSGGDLITDGIIVKEEPEFPLLAAAGGGSGSPCDVAQGVLLGAQALGAAWAQKTQTTEDRYDYGFENGVGIEEIRGISKLAYGTGTNDQDNLKDHGVFTILSAAPGDA